MIFLAYLFIILIPFSFAINPSSSIDLSIIRLIAPILFLAWIFNSLLKKKFFIDKRPRFWFFILFLFSTFLSYFWAIDQERALRKIIFMFTFASLYPIYATITQKNKTKDSLLKFLFSSCVVLAIIGLFQFSLQFIIGLDATQDFFARKIIPFFLGNNFAKLVAEYPSWLVNINGKTVMRAFGIFPDPHLFSLFLNLNLPIGLYLWQKTTQKKYLFFSLVILLTSLLSFSRAAYLSLIAAFMFFIFTKRKLFQLNKKPLLTLISLFFISLLTFSNNHLINRLSSSFNINEGSNSGRIEMLKKALLITIDYPLTGVGLGNFSRYILPESTLRNPIYAHNLFLDFSSETGVITTIILIACLLCPIINYLKNKSLFNLSIALCFIIFITHSFFETPFFSVNVFPLIIILLSLSTDSKKLIPKHL